MIRSLMTPQRVSSLFTLVLVLALSFALAPSTSAEEWKRVENSADPKESPLTISLEEQWRLGGETDDEDEFFGVINRILLDEDGTLFVLDNQLSEVKVYDADGSFLTTLGREGEGPGEFRGPVDMFFTPDGNVGVMQVAPGKIVLLSKDGEPQGEYPLPEGEDGSTPILLGGRLMGDYLALAGQENIMGEGKFTMVRYLAVIDKEGNEVERMHSEERVFEFANAVIDERVWDTFDRRWAVGDDESVYAVTSFPDYEIKVWNADGSKKHMITREYEHRPRSQEEIDRIHSIYEAFTRQAPGAVVKIGDAYKDIQTIYPREDGSLWVLSSDGQHDCPDDALGTFDVFNRKGKFVRQVTLMGEGDPNEDAYFFVRDRVYVVTGFLSAAMAAQGGGTGEDVDEDAAPMAVICYQIDVPDMGM
ncbi:MAG: 6-bladed beta-propeller [Candidatus Eisenbacteria bacterium]|uniref:6-bladed beta-propeller n=1 Tax=Eiseniibacteriota bacterium TaxID=2212470 RepID=A0A7Y2E6B0_UNCEI|nr:6-bladed beta-propeller [Candidatus Eisenbacteria bacterium]